jgi:hypothetical protein
MPPEHLADTSSAKKGKKRKKKQTKETEKANNCEAENTSASRPEPPAPLDSRIDEPSSKELKALTTKCKNATDAPWKAHVRLEDDMALGSAVATAFSGLRRITRHNVTQLMTMLSPYPGSHRDKSSDAEGKDHTTKPRGRMATTASASDEAFLAIAAARMKRTSRRPYFSSVRRSTKSDVEARRLINLFNERVDANIYIAPAPSEPAKQQAIAPAVQTKLADKKRARLDGDSAGSGPHELKDSQLGLAKGGSGVQVKPSSDVESDDDDQSAQERKRRRSNKAAAKKKSTQYATMTPARRDLSSRECSDSDEMLEDNDAVIASAALKPFMFEYDDEEDNEDVREANKVSTAPFYYGVFFAFVSSLHANFVKIT